VLSRFDLDTAVVARGDGRYDTSIDRGWWIERGPNGGYLAAIILRAFNAAVTAPDRHARSLTIHYLAPAVEGPAHVEVTTERLGRMVHYLTARLRQGERLIATAQAAFATLTNDRAFFADPSFPDFPPPEEIVHDREPPVLVSLRERYEYRHVTGAPWDGASHTAETAGWIRLAEPRPYDTALVVAMADAWNPAIFTRLTERFGVPTVDLTVHIRSIGALMRMKPDDWMAARFRTTVATEGFLEEDGQLWAPDGTLIAHSRQLGLLLTG
jgi:acyl-CoA thioesterase